MILPRKRKRRRRRRRRRTKMKIKRSRLWLCWAVVRSNFFVVGSVRINISDAHQGQSKFIQFG